MDTDLVSTGGDISSVRKTFDPATLLPGVYKTVQIPSSSQRSAGKRFQSLCLSTCVVMKLQSDKFPLDDVINVDIQPAAASVTEQNLEAFLLLCRSEQLRKTLSRTMIVLFK